MAMFSFDLLMQTKLHRLGCFIHKNAGKIIWTSILLLMCLLVALQSAKLETNLEKLWVEKQGRVEKELNYINSKLGSTYGTTNQVVIQTPRLTLNPSPPKPQFRWHDLGATEGGKEGGDSYDNKDIKDNNNVLNVRSFIIHLAAMEMATRISIDMFGSTWELKDLCYSPTVPDLSETGEVINTDQFLDKLMPCAIKTPLDCFWEGSKLLHQTSLHLGELGMGSWTVKWTSLNPISFVNFLQGTLPKSSFNYEKLLDWMRRAGIDSAYQKKPCLNPADPQCPITAPNKASGQQPDIGATITGGCYGFAKNHMHWLESEIVGGVEKNKTGFITKANALQSTIQLMDDQQMYEFHVRGYKASNLLVSWSAEKAKDILEAWQREFRERLLKFSQGELEEEPFDIYAMTSSSIDELMDNFSSIDHFKLVVGYLVILVYTCISCPNIRLPKSRPKQQQQNSSSHKELKLNNTTTAITNTTTDLLSSVYNYNQPDNNNNNNNNNTQTTLERSTKIQSASPTSSQESYSIEEEWTIYERLTTIIMAKLGFLLIGLALPASLGVCVLIGLKFNAATTQLLPLLALCLGYHDLMILFQAFSRNTRQDLPIQSLTGVCLREIGLGISISSFSCFSAFLAASIIPVPALRTLSLQAIVFQVFNLISIMIIIPSIFVLILRRESEYGALDLFCCFSNNKTVDSAIYIKTSNNEGNSLVSKSHIIKNQHQNNLPNGTKVKNALEKDNQISSRIKNDLMNVQSVRTTPPQTPLPSFDISVTLNSSRTSTVLTWSSNSIRNGAISSNHNHKDIQDSRNHIKPHHNTFSSANNNNNHLNMLSSQPDLVNHPSRTLDIPLSEYDNQEQTNSISPLNLSVTDVRITTPTYKPTCVEIMIRAFAKLLAQNNKVRILFALIAIALFLFSLTGINKLESSLEFSDLVPRDSLEYTYLTLRRRYFPVFNTFAITKGNFDYAANQKLLHDYHQSFSKVEGIEKNSDGTLPDNWLILFRNWLMELQKSFDLAKNSSAITIDSWREDESLGRGWPEVSENTKLAYRLIVQTGEDGDPIDRNLFNTGRLVNNDGIINPKAFYNYLTAWYTNDAFIYSLSGANLKPEPRLWTPDHPTDLTMRKSSPLVYAQSSYLIKTASTSDILKTISEIRAICHQFELRNLPNFPSGVPFAFWEQFFHLNFHLAVSLIVTLFMIFFSILVTFNIGISFMVTVISLINVVELYGLMGLVLIPFNATQAVVLTISTGLSVCYSIHLINTFMIAEGTRKERTVDTVMGIYAPIFKSWFCTLICTTILMLSPFDYIFKFTLIIQISVALNAINALIIIPVILASFGPEPICFPKGNDQTVLNSIAAEMRFKLKNMPNGTRKYFKRRSYPRVQSEISLSTISEESTNYQSQAHDMHLDLSIRCY